MELGLGFAITYLGLLLGGLYPDRPFSDYIQDIYGRVLGKALLAVSICFFLLPAAFNIRSLGEVIAAIYMPRTPLLATMGALLAAAVYANMEGFPVIARVAWIILTATVFLYVVALALSLANIAEPLALLPSGPVNLGRDAVAIYRGTYVCSTAGAILQILPFLRDRHPGKIRQHLIIAYGVGALLLLLEFVSTVGTLGLQGTAYFVWPAATALRLVAVSDFFIDRFGYLTIIGLAGMVFVYQAVWIRSIALAMDDLFTGERRRIHLYAGLAGALILIVAMLPGSEASLEMMVFNYLSPWVVFFYGLALPVTLGLALWRRRRSRPNRSMV